MGRKKSIFKGCATAIITPFKDGKIDYVSLKRLIEFQINNGVDAIVILGTTGEAVTVSEEERYEIIKFAKNVIKSRVPLIVGCGSNDTKKAVCFTKIAEELNADGALIVTPYYNKASESGLILHYKTVAESTSIPIIMYNVPSRTGVNIPINVYKELAKVDNLVGIKEASGNISYVSDILSNFSADYYVYSGCDELTLPVLALGGYGVISAVSNVVPSYMHQMCLEFFKGSIPSSAYIQLYLKDLINEMFAEVNPIPIKTALYKMGMCENEFRLPMCRSSREKQIEKILMRYSLIEKG